MHWHLFIMVKKDLTTLALHGKTIAFDKVIRMIDAMVETLKEEQKDEDHKKEYCTSQLDLGDDKRKHHLVHCLMRRLQ